MGVKVDLLHSGEFFYYLSGAIAMSFEARVVAVRLYGIDEHSEPFFVARDVAVAALAVPAKIET